MTIRRMDHTSIVVEDMAEAVAFFTALGMEMEGQAPVEGPWVDQLCGLKGVKVDITMMRTPDGHGRVELTRFRAPKLVPAKPAVPPPHMRGLRQIMFAVDNLETTLARLRKHGAKPVGRSVQYGNQYKLCYVRGPAEVIIALAEEIS